MRVADGRSVAGLTALVLLTWAGLATAQIAPPPPASNPLRFGQLSIFPGIQVRDAGIDSNVFNSNVPREDFTYTVVPRVQAELPVGIARLAGASSLGFVYYRTFKDQQSIDSSAEGELNIVEATRVRPFASAGFVRTRERVGDDIDARALWNSTNVRVGLDVQVGAITSLTAWVRRDKTGYGQNQRFQDVELSEQLDHSSELVAAGAKFAITPLTTILLAAEVQQARFEGAPLRDTNSLRVGPSVTFATGAVITGRAAAGYREFKPLDARLPRYRGFVGSAGVSFTIANLTRFDISGNRDLNYSYHELEPFYLESGGRVTVSQRIVGPLELIVLGGRRRLQYQSIGEASLEGRSQTITTVGGGIGIRMGNSMRFTLTYDRTQRKSTGPAGLDYERNRVLGSVDYAL